MRHALFASFMNLLIRRHYNTFYVRYFAYDIDTLQRQAYFSQVFWSGLPQVGIVVWSVHGKNPQHPSGPTHTCELHSREKETPDCRSRGPDGTIAVGMQPVGLQAP